MGENKLGPALFIALGIFGIYLVLTGKAQNLINAANGTGSSSDSGSSTSGSGVADPSETFRFAQDLHDDPVKNEQFWAKTYADLARSAQDHIGKIDGALVGLKATLKAEIDKEAWDSLNSDTSRPFPKPSTGRIAVKVINHLGDEVMKVFRV